MHELAKYYKKIRFFYKSGPFSLKPSEDSLFAFYIRILETEKIEDAVKTDG